MIRIHNTGYPTLLLSLLVLGCLAVVAYIQLPQVLGFAIITLCVGVYIFLLSFFRNPVRTISKFDDTKVYAPADGKVVVIEPVENADYFQDKRIQVSIFMSPLNVHVNRAAIGGVVDFVEHRNGKYMPAWNPKSSTDNEQCVTVITNNKGQTILLKQIAGALARRIVNFTRVGATLEQGQEYGFIKFGSRVDILLPPESKVLVNKEQVVKGNIDIIAELPTS